jgi:GT2 family glycosyltransferase
MIGLVHLVWVPLGPDPLRAFLRSYQEHPAGADHELVIVLNGAGLPATAESEVSPSLSRELLLAELEGTTHRLIVLEQPVLDLAAYHLAAEQLDHARLCFLNSYSAILADGWLAHLVGAAELPGVGVAAATGSWESQAEWARGRMRDWPRQLSAVRVPRRDYPRFPNPHIRTTAFTLERSLALELGLNRAHDKRAAYLLESGWRSITRQLQERGLRAVVVGRDGHAYEAPEWARSRTYRSGEQDNLLVADNRTGDWQSASRRVRRSLSRDAWGEPEPAGPAAPMSLPVSPVSISRNPPRPSTGDPVELDGAIVIVNYRTPELVERCLESVRATSGPLRLEIVVVDNDSSDGSFERMSAALPDATVLSMPENRGFAAGVNAGFRHTSAELVIVLNPDTEVRPDALRALLARLREHPHAGVLAPLLEDHDGQLAPNGYRRFPSLFTLCLEMCVPLSYALAYVPALHPYAIAPADLETGGPVAHVTGAAMAIRRSAYMNAGELDEGFFLYLEETEWQRRVADCGWAIELEPAARVVHLVRGGGEEALVPPAHGITSAMRYLRMQGVPVPISRACLALALATSWVTLCLIACLPGKRAKAMAQARAYRSLAWRALTAACPPLHATPARSRATVPLR